MDLATFATTHRLKIKKDSCGDEIIPGRPIKKFHGRFMEDRHHVYHIDGNFGVYLNMPTSGRWNNARKKLEAAGATTVVNCEADGMLRFNPEDVELVKLVCRIARIVIRKPLTEEQRAALAARLASNRPKERFLEKRED